LRVRWKSNPNTKFCRFSRHTTLTGQTQNGL
jgi:hypothetical protein